MLQAQGNQLSHPPIRNKRIGHVDLACLKPRQQLVRQALRKHGSRLPEVVVMPVNHRVHSLLILDDESDRLETKIR